MKKKGRREGERGQKRRNKQRHRGDRKRGGVAA